MNIITECSTSLKTQNLKPATLNLSIFFARFVSHHLNTTNNPTKFTPKNHNSFKTSIKTFPSYCSLKERFCVDNKLFLINFILLTWYFFFLPSSYVLPCVFSFLFISINATKYYDYSDYFLTIHSLPRHKFLPLCCCLFCVTYFAYLLVSAIIFVFKLMLMFFESFSFLCVWCFCAVDGIEE